ncbi:NUDIX domain-containing protein [Kribbella sp. WER1]
MNPDLPLYERDPEAFKNYLAEGNAKQARKRVGADAILKDCDGRILLVDPAYKPDWDLPGGMIEANEPPVDGLRRELLEELDLKVPSSRLELACIDWVSPHGPWDDSLMFVFDGGALSASEVENIHLRDGELKKYTFGTESQAQERLRPYVWRRLEAALRAFEAGSVAYLHDGRKI